MLFRSIFSRHLNIPEGSVRVICRDIGGAYGIKVHVYPDEMCTAALSVMLRRPVKFVAEFEVAPTFDLGEYRGLVCTYSEPEVTEEDLTKRIDQLRDSKAEFVNEEPRALVDGDHASISLESLSGVDEKVSQDELTLKLGDEHTLKEFTEALRGAAAEDRQDVEQRLLAFADYDLAADVNPAEFLAHGIDSGLVCGLVEPFAAPLGGDEAETNADNQPDDHRTQCKLNSDRQSLSDHRGDALVLIE